jgi:hypothetical protein
MEYLDFELRIAPGAGREYPVSVLHSPAGEASGTMRFPFDTLALQSNLQMLQIALLRSGGVRRDVMSDEQQSVVEFGQRLFEALMPDAVRESFRRSQDRARSAGRGLRLRLRIEAPELAALPWEYLYDPSDGDYVCLSRDTPVVRYLELDRPPEPVEVHPPLSILGMIVSPSDRAALDVQRERQRVEGATAALRGAGLLKLTWLEGSTWRDLQKAMRQGPFHIFHFVGHGGFDSTSREGVVALTDEAGKTALLSATQLGRVLADHQSLQMVVLNSCLGAKGSGTDVFSSTASILVRRGVPAVIAMQYEISDDAAVEFAHSLYEALADAMPVDAAVAEARKAISLSVTNTVEWGTPVLFMRSPDGVLFRIIGMTPSVARASGRLSGARVAPVETPQDAAQRPAAVQAQRAAEQTEQRRQEAAAEAKRQVVAQVPTPRPQHVPPAPARTAVPRRRRFRKPAWWIGGSAVVVIVLLWARSGGKQPSPLGPTVDFRAEPTVVQRGERTTLTWAVENADTARLEVDENGDGGWVALAELTVEADRTTRGSREVFPNRGAFYRVFAFGPGGGVAGSSIPVEVTPPHVVLSLADSIAAVTAIQPVWTGLRRSANRCGGTFDYFPEGGMRIFYCHLQSLNANPYALLQRLAGTPAFVQGPHSAGTLSLQQRNAFGHYDPRFVGWMVDYLVPGAHDSQFRSLTQPLYDEFVKPLARVFFVTYQKAQADSACFGREVREYAAKVDGRQLPPGYYERFYGFMGDGFCQSGGLDDGGYDGNVVKTTVAFWIRRTIDGTAGDFYRGLEKLLQTYDPDLLATSTSR